MRRGSNNRETPKGVRSSKTNRQLVTCRPFRDSCMRTKPNSYRHGSYRLGSVYRQGSKTLFHAYGPSVTVPTCSRYSAYVWPLQCLRVAVTVPTCSRYSAYLWPILSSLRTRYCVAATMPTCGRYSAYLWPLQCLLYLWPLQCLL